MTTNQKRKILIKIQSLEGDIEALRQCRIDIAKNGYASASLSSGGGSKAYTRMDISKITETISELSRELAEYREMLSTGTASQFRTHTILHVWG